MRELPQFPTCDDATPLGLGNHVRVVIADDERDTVMTLGILLRSEGFDVRLLQGGADVPKAVAAAHPHAVLLDIGMPDRDGYELARELKRTYGDRCPMLIAVTARVSDADRAKASASGFDHYIPKPYNASELLKLLSALQSAPTA